MKIREYLRKGFSVLTILVYIFVMLFQNIPFLNLISNVEAEDVANKDNIVLVLVDGDIYNNIKSDINYYAGYIQRQNKNIKALVLPIDTKLVSAYDIQKVISNLYFNGEKTKTSFLKGIVLVGNVPLPVINNNGYVFSSIYPYVDIVKPAFKYEDGGYFIPTGKASDAELIHGLIKFSNINDYHKYFQKLQQYESNPANFVEKKFYYDNFVSQNNSYNKDNEKFYVNKLIFAANLVSKKITPLILSIFDEQNRQQLDTLQDSIDNLNNLDGFDTFKAPTNVTKGGFVTSSMGFDNLSQTTDIEKEYKEKLEAYGKKIKDMVSEINSIDNNYWLTPTLSLESVIKNFVKNYTEIYGSEYISEMDKNLQATGRYTWANTVSTLNSTDTKDDLSVSYLYKINKFLEQELDKEIDNQQYYMYYPIMTKYLDTDVTALATDENGALCEGDKYETFFFGKNANNLSSLSEINIYRGTYGNIKNISDMSKISSRGGKSSFSIMNNLFDIQTISNRAFNLLGNTKKDGDNYKKNCSKTINNVCLDLGKKYSSEKILPWSKRIFGGYSPLNQKISGGDYDPNNIKFNYENYKYAWSPSYAPNKNGTLFDLAGTVENKNKESTIYTDTISGIFKYASIWKTEYVGTTFLHANTDNGCNYADGLTKVSGNYYDYFALLKNIEDNCTNDINGFHVGGGVNVVNFIAPDKFKISGDDDGACSVTEDKEIYYKLIDTKIKHVSPNKDEFSKFNAGTLLRPVDSKDYITFLGVGGNQVILDYPDIFSVEVYKKAGGKYVLKTPNEILSSIKSYLIDLVKDYNYRLETELNNKNTYYNNYKVAFDNLRYEKYKPHNYNLLDENYFIDKLGEEKLSQVAEMLYYLNLPWKEKPTFSNLKDEIDYLYSSFDVNNKVAYEVSNFIDTESENKVGDTDISKEDLNYVGKPKTGYEAGMIISKNIDNIGNNQDEPGENQYFTVPIEGGYFAPPLAVEEEQEEECGRPLGEGVILWEWPAAFMCRLKETLKKPFKIGSTSACSMGEPLGFGSEESEDTPDVVNEQLEEEYTEQGGDALEEFEYLKDYVNNELTIKTNQPSYLNDDFTGSIIIRKYSDFGTFATALSNPITSMYIWSPKEEGNCMYIKTENGYKNTCEGLEFPMDRWKLDFAFFNLDTGEGKYYSYKAGQKVMGFKFCTSNNICYVKGLYFDKLAGPIKDVEIKPFSPVMVYGGENPIVILGYDAKKGEPRYRNQVSYSTYNYDLYLDPPVGEFKYDLQKTGKSKISYNFDATQKLLLVKTTIKPDSRINKFNIVLKLNSNWEKILSGEDNVFKGTSTSIGISEKKTLLDNEVKLIPNNYQLPANSYSLITRVDGIKTYNKEKLLKLHIEPKVNGKTLKTPVDIESSQHFIVGDFKEVKAKNSSGDIVTYEKFYKKNRFLITKDKGLDVYLLPTYKTGKYKLTIKIPGLDDYIIDGKLDDFPIDSLYIKLDKYKAKKGEKVNGIIYAVDKFKNLRELKPDEVKITTSSGVRVSKSGNKIIVSAIKNGFIKLEYNGKEKVVNFVVENSFLPLNKKISVMYLTLLGYDWGKYAPKIMVNSNKNLAITTTLHDKNNILYYDYIIGGNLKNQGDFVTYLDFNQNQFKINLGGFYLTYTGNIFGNVKEISNIDNIFSDGIYYMKSQLDDIIKSNEFKDNTIYVNNTKIIDFSRQVKKSGVKIIYNPELSKKYGVYDIIYNNRKIGDLVFKGNIIPIGDFVPSQDFYTNIINGDGSTNGVKALGISVSGVGSYDVIAKSTALDIEKDKGLGFRSNFRNITDFAAGNNVGQSTKPFENELLINFGDPFVKRISSEDVNPQVKVSKTYGKRIFTTINSGIKKVLTLDFNNDGLKDIVIAYKGNKLRILKNYKGYNNFEDLGNLLVLGNNISDIFAGDVDGDGYEDLFVIFNNKTIRVYRNNKGEFDVNGDLICLPLSGTDGEHLDYEQIFFRDMNNDKKTDIVVNDKSSDINVFFGPSYLSKDKKTCDAGYVSRIVKKHVKSYGLTVNENTKFADAGYIYREGIKNNSAYQNTDNSGVINPDDYFEDVMGKTAPRYAFQPIPKVLGPSYLNTDERYIDFKKITFLSGDDITVYKTMKSIGGENLLPGNKVEVTVHIENPSGKKLTYLEVFKGPFAVISENNKPILKYEGIDPKKITFPEGAYREFLFRLDDTSSKNIEITYTAYYLGESLVTIKVGDRDKNDYGDIKVFLNNSCIKGYDYFQGQSGTPMSFNYSFVNLAEKLREFDSNSPGKSSIGDIQDKIENGDYEELLDEYMNEGDDDIYGGILEDLANGESVSIEINGPDISSIKNRIDSVLKGLCNGYSFGKSSCSGSPIPCNFAFFAPGDINVCGCTVGKDPGMPVFWYPGTIYVPDPIPAPNGLMYIPTKFDPMGPAGGKKDYMSQIRLYISPTLSMGLGVAVCFGPYAKGMKMPTKPVGSIMGNCIVVAKDLEAKCDNKEGDEVLDEWMDDLGANGTCNQLPIETGSFPNSPFGSFGTDSFEGEFVDISSNGLQNAGISINGQSLIQFDATAHKINAMAEEEELLEGGEPLNLHIKTGTFKGIISCVIKKWLNHQIQFAISQLTKMTIYITYPDMNGLMKGFEEKDWGNFGKGGTDFGKVINDLAKGGNTKYSKYLPNGEGLSTLSKQLSNPFNAVKSYLEDIPLVNVSMKTVVIQVPWIGKDEVDRQIAYLEGWLADNQKVIDSRKKLPENAPNMLKVNKFVNSIKKNIQILKMYKEFPLKLYKYLHALDFYLDQIMCVIKMYVKLIVGWLNTQSRIFEKWVDAIVSLINIFKTWQLLIDVSVDWKSSCGKCRQDTGDAYDCTLMGLCPSLPVLPIPPFKIPDIFIDFTHIDVGLDIILPKIKIRPVPIGLFTLPTLPYIAPNLELPPVPILPAPPELPDLPGIPPVPTIELPNLPPPPLIPELLPSLQVALNVFKIVGYFRCIIKNGIGLVAEWNVKTRIEQLTARHNRLFPFDFINIDFPELPWKGFDVRVDGYLRFRMDMSALYDAVKSFADKINEKTKPMIGEMLKFNVKANEATSKYDIDEIDIDIKADKVEDKVDELNKKSRETESKWQEKVDDKARELFNYNSKNPFIINSKKIDSSLARSLLNNELKVFISQKGEGYLSRLPKYYFDTAKEILKDNEHIVKVEGNISGIKKIEKDITRLVNKQHLQIDKAKAIIEKLERGEKIDLTDNIFVKDINNNLVSENNTEDETIVYKTSLFKTDKKTFQILSEAKDPKEQYIDMYSKLVKKMESKLEKYKNNKEKYYDLETNLDNTKKVLKSLGEEKLAYATANNNKVNAIIADPSQTIKGLYMEGEDGLYYNVLADKDRAKKIRTQNKYLLSDVNNDGYDDLIWYDNYSVYIKYSQDEPKDNGIVINTRYIYNGIITSFEEITDDNGYLLVSDSKFKLWDKTRAINNLEVVGNNPTNIRIKWTKTNNVNAYVVLYNSRVDILNDVEKKFSDSSDFTYEGKTFKTYALVIYDSNLGDISTELGNNINIIGHQVVAKQFKGLDFEDRINFNTILAKTKLYYPNKWKYFRIYNANLNKNSKTVEILSSYSNQDVGGNQIVGDDQAPYVTPELIRKKTGEVIGTGTRLVAYLNTEYILKANWEDEVGIKNKYITDANFNKLVDGDILNISPKKDIEYKYYYLVGEDYNGNIRKQRLAIQFTVPKISIKNINKDAGKISSELGHDMDVSAVKYAIINGNNVRIVDSIEGREIFTGGVNDTIITGAIFDNQNKVILYNKNQEPIGSFDLLNGKLEVKSPYYIVGTTDSGTLYYNVYNEKGQKLFSVYIPPKEIVKPLELYTSSKYSLKKIENNNLGKFNNGSCLYDRQNQICAMYISSRGEIYVDNAYQDKFMFDYDFNALGNISVTAYDLSVPDKLLFTNDKKIFNYIFKAKSFINK